MQPLPPIANIHTIDDVVNAIETIVQWSLANQSRLGYFAALYKRITLAIRKNLPTFQDPPRLAQLDVVFASRYFAALNAWFYPAQFPQLSHAWRVAFQAAALPNPIIVQHLLAGVNAHIDLDLGIAAATVSPGSQIDSLHADFDKVNAVLMSQVMAVLDQIDSLSPRLAELYDIFMGPETEAINAILAVTRAEAWKFATDLAPAGRIERDVLITVRDIVVAKLGSTIITPPLFAQFLLNDIAAVETRDVVKIITTLNAQAEAMR